jgi:hypothetical protein
MKRIVSLMLALSMILGVFATSLAVDYTDLTGENAKFASAVDALTELKVIDGFPDETFRPLDDLTRAQVAKMLVICLGLGDQVESLSARTVFSDVASSHWASGFINAAAQSKIIVGYPDGTFRPDAKVTYAEAFTMALRALGYGNVVEAEGTWPTAYMLKAVELELTDEMEGVAADKPALRGNTAILLWNMLRTPMWKIYEESQGNGMTLTAHDDLMLNVKFPKYWYYEDVYLANVTVDQSDDNKVKAILTYEDGAEAQSGYVRVDTDISRLVLGTKIASLVRDYKDTEKATFLTLTRDYSFVEGLVTSVEKIAEGRIEIENVEYKLGSGVAFDADLELAENDYVVVEVDGKKIIGFDGDAVMKVLPNAGTEVTKPSTLKSKIDEDALVIIDGKWSTRDDIQEGDVYTELGPDNDTVDGDNYYMVARERVEGSFESLTFEKEDDERMYFEVDGAEYRTFEDKIKNSVYEGEDKDKVEDAIEKLTKKKSENDYLDKEVALVLNYLGQVVKAYFGDVKGNGTGANFFAVMSNGVREVTDPDTGDTALKIRLANSEDPEGTMHLFSTKFDVNNFDGTEIEKGVVFDNAEGDSGEVVFVWAKFNDKDEIKSISVLKAGLTPETYGEDDVFAYDDDFAFADFTQEYDKSSGYIHTADGDFKVTSSTVVYKLTPETDDEDDQVVGFEFEVADDAKTALQGVDKGLVAYDSTTKINKNGQIMTASYVFIMEDAISADLEVGKADGAKESRGITYVNVNGEYEEVDLDNKKSDVEDFADVKELVDSFIVFQRTDSDKIIIRGALSASDLSEASIVMAREDSIVQLEEGPLEGDIDLDNDDDPLVKEYDDYQIIQISASVNKDNEVEFDDGENVGTGLPAGSYSKGYRVYVDKDLEVVYIVEVEGVDEDDVINEDGTVTFVEDADKPATSGDSTTTPDDSGDPTTTTPDDSGDPTTTTPDDSGDPTAVTPDNSGDPAAVTPADSGDGSGEGRN